MLTWMEGVRPNSAVPVKTSKMQWIEQIITPDLIFIFLSMLESWKDSSELVICVLVWPLHQTDTCFAQAGHDSCIHGCPHGSLARAGLPVLWHQGAAAWGAPAPPSPHFHQLLKVQQQLFLVRGDFGSSSATSLWHNFLWVALVAHPSLPWAKVGFGSCFKSQF